MNNDRDPMGCIARDRRGIAGALCQAAHGHCSDRTEFGRGRAAGTSSFSSFREHARSACRDLDPCRSDRNAPGQSALGGKMEQETADCFARVGRFRLGRHGRDELAPLEEQIARKRRLQGGVPRTADVLDRQRLRNKSPITTIPSPRKKKDYRRIRETSSSWSACVRSERAGDRHPPPASVRGRCEFR